MLLETKEKVLQIKTSTRKVSGKTENFITDFTIIKKEIRLNIIVNVWRDSEINSNNYRLKRKNLIKCQKISDC